MTCGMCGIGHILYKTKRYQCNNKNCHQEYSYYIHYYMYTNTENKVFMALSINDNTRSNQ